MSDKGKELKPSAKDSSKKYVAVVYHHVSYQNEEGAVSLEDGRQGSVEHVSRRLGKPGNCTPDVPDYFMLSLFSLVVFLPTGIVAVDSSLRVRKALQNGNVTNAIEASNWTLQHSLTTFFIGPLFACMLFLIIYLQFYQIK